MRMGRVNPWPIPIWIVALRSRGTVDVLGIEGLCMGNYGQEGSIDEGGQVGCRRKLPAKRTD